MDKIAESSSCIAGLAIILAMFTGVAALFVALLALFNDFNWMATGMSLLAAALSFGLVANAVFRK